MTIPQETFDAATARLHKGINLVEASAGTGKTFAIAMLVLRFVTEFGFPLQNILVVTFTKAATEELKERIRARLASARELLDHSHRPDICCQSDPALTAWHAGLAEHGISEHLARERLELALLDMDLAAVFTIHSFCQRMLQEQALESGQLFDFTLTTDLSSQRNQVIHDYWRRHVYRLSPLHCALITGKYRTPDDLYNSIRGTGKRGERIEPQAQTVTDALDAFDKRLLRLSDWWRTKADTLHSCLEKALAGGKFKTELQNNFSGWWRQMDDFLLHNSLQLPESMEFFSTEGMMKALNGHKFRAGGGQGSEDKKQAFIASLPLPEQELADFRQAWQDVTLAFRMGLVHELATGLSHVLRRQNLLSFDDLISQLEKGLLGSQGPELRQIISDRYQAALIDEFQDTDNAQYTIFSALFAGSSHYLYLIGDPKQAIYTFRGADIYSYFKAREQADIHLNLARNYRSHPALVTAINQLFQLRKDAFASKELSYQPVLPAKNADDGQLLADGKSMAVMVYCELAASDAKDGRWSSGKATKQIVSYVVTEIARLLSPVSPIMLTATNENMLQQQALAPRDIAILVRSHKQAEQFQAALAHAGIPAVMASQQSVFTTSECHDLFLLMQALSSPGDSSLLKTALTSSWFSMDGMELYASWQDPEQVDQWLTRFHDYHLLWQERGFLAMMTRLLETEKILINLTHQPLAERKISNIHHLLELIQTAETDEAMGPAKTLQWLQTMKEEQRGMEDTELRLESDEEAVKIVTMHSAKGLEYPVVFSPFLWHRNNYLKTAKDCVTCHDGTEGTGRELVMDLGSPLFEERKAQALQEELAEELRLAYVALTRARCRCYAFWAEVKGNRFIADSRESALAWLLSLEQGLDFATRIQTLQTQAADKSVVYEVLAADNDEPVMISNRQERTDELMPLSFTGRHLHTDWLLHSYSSLTHQADTPSARADRPAGSNVSEAAATVLLPDLPKGAPLGNVVHGLLENVSFATLAEGSGLEETIKQQCVWFGVEATPSKVAALLQKVVQTPLSASRAASFSLADLEQTEIIREMPFYFRLQPGSTDQINALLAGSPTVTPVAPKAINGYLTGFIDLICRYQGRFYIMDYKSNWLGNRLSDYGQQALEQAMRDHNYGLQYWLYTLMLHRYLQSTMSDYDYAAHFGGVMYLFVRGMEPSTAGSGVYFDLPDLAILKQLDRCLGRSGAQHCGGSDNG
ncbi:MAG: exodeoxyribonuclease V subunit beta [Proteobacteria bacterium]|nr:exodeoxyribonuclease V subunit beta [Pseudomonadota bacterium]MBU1648160.1 exodeoxyribonuclease V subunit beta [Pseudomonadota bacterium]